MASTIRNQNSRGNSRHCDTQIYATHIKVDFWRRYDANKGGLNPGRNERQPPGLTLMRAALSFLSLARAGCDRS
jgi:hypothetical protein